MIESTAALRQTRTSAWAWGAAFVGGMIGWPLLVELTGIRSGWTPFVLFLPMLLLVPFVAAANRHNCAKGFSSPAETRYRWRMAGVSFLYVAALLAAVYAMHALHPRGAAAWILAIVPSLPILGMIWTMGRYLVEETDEYLRARVVTAALIATGLVLAVATIWGFLESFRLVPHIPGWAVVPLWGTGLGFGNLVRRHRA